MSRTRYAMLCRCLAEGFGYQGADVRSPREAARGEPSAHLPPTAFVNFLQNHDQIGNRAFGERIDAIARSEEALRAAYAVLLLAPSPPMLFMGEEWEAPQPFPYFCDFEPELAAKVREGRKREFARFEKFRDKGGLAALPDPTSLETFRLGAPGLERAPATAARRHPRSIPAAAGHPAAGHRAAHPEDPLRDLYQAGSQRRFRRRLGDSMTARSCTC